MRKEEQASLGAPQITAAMPPTSEMGHLRPIQSILASGSRPLRPKSD